MEVKSAMCAPLYYQGRIGGLVYIDRVSKFEPFTATDLEVLSILASVSAVAVERTRMQESITREKRARERLSRYHAPAVVDHIIRDDAHGTRLSAELREITVLFADMVGFTTFSESKAPEEVTSVLNEVFTILTEEVFQQQGTLDKFNGDGLMAFFGAPLDQPDHALRAVRTAMAMQRRLIKFNQGRQPDEYVRVRVGVNSGFAVAGDIGCPDRRDYTVIGDTVNVAARLEAYVAKAGDVVIGPETYAAVRGHFSCDALEPIKLKGKAREVQAYRVLDEGSTVN